MAFRHLTAIALLLCFMTASPVLAEGDTEPYDPLWFFVPLDLDWPQREHTDRNNVDSATDLSLELPGATDLPRKAFSEGSWTLHMMAGTLVGDEDKGRLHSANLGVGYFFADGWSINVEGFGGLVQSEVDDNGGVGGVDVLFRYHFIRGNGWSTFIEGGGGIQMASTYYPSDSHFTFRPQMGMGATFNLRDNTNLYGGARYLHISNANLSEINDGQDGAFLYLGIMLTY